MARSSAVRHARQRLRGASASGKLSKHGASGVSPFSIATARLRFEPRSKALPSLSLSRSSLDHTIAIPAIPAGPTAQPIRPYSSVSPTEVSHFNALASSWWDPQGPSRILHLMNSLRHDFITACRASVPAPHHTREEGTANTGLTYLDVGCGGGIFAESAARLSTTKSVTAIDPTPELIRIAEAHARRDPLLQQKGKLQYLNTSIEHLSAPAPPSSTTTEVDPKQTQQTQQQYDIVTVFEVLEHVTHPSAFLDRVMSLVKPGGWLVLSTLARTWMSWLTTIVVAEDMLRMIPRGTHDWEKYVNPAELERHFLGARSGWADVRVRGVVYVPGLGWREVRGSERVGNYFWAVRRVE